MSLNGLVVKIKEGRLDEVKFEDAVGDVLQLIVVHGSRLLEFVRDFEEWVKRGEVNLDDVVKEVDVLASEFEAEAKLLAARGKPDVEHVAMFLTGTYLARALIRAGCEYGRGELVLLGLSLVKMALGDVKRGLVVLLAALAWDVGRRDVAGELARRAGYGDDWERVYCGLAKIAKELEERGFPVITYSDMVREGREW